MPSSVRITPERTQKIVADLRSSDLALALQEQLAEVPPMRLTRRNYRGVTGWVRSFELTLDAVPAQIDSRTAGWQGLQVGIGGPIERYAKPVLSSRGTPYRFQAGYFRSQPHLAADAEGWATSRCVRSIDQLPAAWGWSPKMVHLAVNTSLHRGLRGQGIGGAIYTLLLRFASQQGSPSPGTIVRPGEKLLGELGEYGRGSETRTPTSASWCGRILGWWRPGTETQTTRLLGRAGPLGASLKEEG